MLGLLHGLPVSIKDLEATANLRTTLGSNSMLTMCRQRIWASLRMCEMLVDHTRQNQHARVWCRCEYAKFGIGATGNPFNPEDLWGSSGGSAVARRLAWYLLQADLITAAACAHPLDFAE